MSLDLPGFADPVVDAQASFRAVLDAMAHPGRIVILPACPAPPAGLTPAAAAVLLTLIDADAPLWLAPALAAAQAWLAFHCGARLTDDPAHALFVLADGVPDLTGLRAGSEQEPEQSATVLAQIAGLGHGTALRLTGPGILGAQTLLAAGLPDDFPGRWAANRRHYPRGVDLLLCCGDRLAALPRSVTVGAG